MGTLKPDPKKFAEPHTWATWIMQRNPQFKTHTSLGQCKNAVSARMTRDKLVCDAYVYQWDNDMAEWSERFFLGAGTEKQTHVLYQTVARRVEREVKPPSQKEIDKAIASIRRTSQEIPQ